MGYYRLSDLCRVIIWIVWSLLLILALTVSRLFVLHNGSLQLSTISYLYVGRIGWWKCRWEEGNTIKQSHHSGSHTWWTIFRWVRWWRRTSPLLNSRILASSLIRLVSSRFIKLHPNLTMFAHLIVNHISLSPSTHIQSESSITSDDMFILLDAASSESGSSPTPQPQYVIALENMLPPGNESVGKMKVSEGISTGGNGSDLCADRAVGGFGARDNRALVGRGSKWQVSFGMMTFPLSWRWESGIPSTARLCKWRSSAINNNQISMSTWKTSATSWCLPSPTSWTRNMGSPSSWRFMCATPILPMISAIGNRRSVTVASASSQVHSCFIGKWTHSSTSFESAISGSTKNVQGWFSTKSWREISKLWSTFL